MTVPLTRREFLLSAGATAAATGIENEAEAAPQPGWIVGKMTGSQAIVQALLLEGAGCVFGIPGAQGNELWDDFKSGGIDYMLVAHEFSASMMADGYARSTGKPGVVCLVPGPGLTNALTGIGEALLDSVPMVCLVGDVARGEDYRPFQVHDLPQADLLRPVTKATFEAECVQEVPLMVRQAFALAVSGEPGPVGVVVPYPLLMEVAKFRTPPVYPQVLAPDADAFTQSVTLLRDRRRRVGIYAGMGCMDASPVLTQVAEMLQAPVATSVSGKGVISDRHPLAVGYGYGPQGTGAAEKIFKDVDVVLAVGVKYSEVSTAYYNVPKKPCLIHVDAEPENLGRIVPAAVKIACDAGDYFERLLANRHLLCRAEDDKLQKRIGSLKAQDRKRLLKSHARAGADPVLFLHNLRCALDPAGMMFMDVSLVEHWASESFETYYPRTYFNPTDNQAMGWSIPAAIGAQKAFPGRQTVAVTGDGCFLMSAMELSTAAREGLPVKVFVLDNQCYQYMQSIQKPAYLRTTATVLARLDYGALAAGLGLDYLEILADRDCSAAVRHAMCNDRPTLIRVATDFEKRPSRWIDAVSDRFIEELSTRQKMRFIARIGGRSLDLRKAND